MNDYSDEFWYQRLLCKDSVGKRLNSEEKSTIMKFSMQEAANQLLLIEKKYGKKTPEEYLSLCGFQIQTEEFELMPSFMYMGLLVPDEKKVLLNETVIRLGESRMKIRLSSDDPMYTHFREIILYHELYHCIEELNPEIYTRNVQICCRIFGPITGRRRVEAASEIGAVHFSKLAAGVSFCPYLYTQYLLAATKQDTEVNDEF